MISTVPSCLYPLTLRAQLKATELGHFLLVVLHWEITAQIAVTSSAAHLLSFLLSRNRCVLVENKSLPAYHTMGCLWNAFFEAIFVVYIVFM